MKINTLRQGADKLFGADISSSSASRLGLQRLLLLRALVTLLSVGGAIIFALTSAVELPLALIMSLLTGIGISLLLGFWRLKSSRLISNLELCGHLTLDMAFVVILVLYTGGASNPLISYLLVLMAVGATLLRQLYVNIFTLAAIGVYTLFLISDLRSEHASHMMINYQLHLVGMWVTFVVSAVLITVFVSRMAATIRKRELALAETREDVLRNEQLVAIGTLAAGTAHALGTPLSTMSVLLSEMEEQGAEAPERPIPAEDIALLKQQVLRCKESLNQLPRFYNKAGNSEIEEQFIAGFADDIKDYIINIHPRARIDFELEPGCDDCAMPPDITLKHAVINVIENAIRAATDRVLVRFQLGRSGEKLLEISIQDDGPGIPPEVMEKMGEPFISTRKDSMGLGIFLANASVQRNGGTIKMYNLKSGGAITHISLPLRD